MKLGSLYKLSFLRTGSRLNGQGIKLPDGVLNWENSWFEGRGEGVAEGKLDMDFDFTTCTGVAFLATTARILSWQIWDINVISNL